MSRKTIFITAGGTGGHVFPALSLYNHLSLKKLNPKIITDERGNKYLKNYPNLNLEIIKSYSIFGKNLLSLIVSLIKVLSSIFYCLKIILKNRPSLVFGMGGYTSFPMCLAARFLLVPVVIYENNIIFGKTNKVLQFFSKKILFSYKDIKGVNTLNKSKITVIGNIIRKEILDYKNSKTSDLNNQINILVLGGSQAAKIFGDKLPGIFLNCKKNNINLKIFQQCMKNQKEEIEKFYKENSINGELFTFNNSILDYFRKTDIAITRSGASISAELINCRIPFISVPLPSSADNHQFFNSIYLKEKGLNIMLTEDKIESELFELIKILSKDKSIIDQIIEKQKKYSDREVFKKIDEVLEAIL
tara:strand:+ start:459 stop:1538 length:1080 start_codon:yes stop_codon:yes gene_type:complete